MIKAETLLQYEFTPSAGSKIEFCHGNWEYMFNTTTQELWDINDGVGEPTLLTRIDNLDHLKMVMLAYDGTDLDDLEFLNDDKA